MVIKLFEQFINEEKFTFKTNKPTGRYKAFDNEWHDIKLNGKIVGSIDHKSPFKLRFMVMKNGTTVKDDNPNCKWKWITLKHESSSLEDAKIWANQMIDKIRAQYELHLSD